MPGIIVELCGSWVWVSGNTYGVKESLKQLGFRFSSKKKMWYFHEDKADISYCGRRKEKTMADIRNKYGSTSVKYKADGCLA